MDALHFANLRGFAILLTHREASLTPADVVIEVNPFVDSDIRVIEDAHLSICHILAGEVKARIAESAKAVAA